MLSSGHEKHHPKMEYQLDWIGTYSDQPERIDLILSALKDLSGVDLMMKEVGEQTFWEVLESVHTPDYLKALRLLSEAARDEDEYFYPVVHPRRLYNTGLQISQIIGYYSIDNFAPIGKDTYGAALEAARTAYACAEEMAANPETPVYALVRPPGHHAGRDYMGGYCYLNNAAIAARRLVEMGRVAILDVDYHHGNGTQEIFWHDADVLYVSIHGDPDQEYPLYSGRIEEKGGELAHGFNINFPLPGGTKRDEYLQVLDKALEAIITFQPRYLVISLGVDTYKNDPTGEFLLEQADFGAIGRRLAKTGLPLLILQEGGYDLLETGKLVAELLINACG
ncbi:MAG: histone deacetylase family protein [Anaerolineales bacterium]|nr:histone deacetylase family protein [Anaerolineales bacterium]